MCQAFLDLRLISPLQSQNDRIFRDSYIMYHLREVSAILSRISIYFKIPKKLPLSGFLNISDN